MKLYEQSEKYFPQIENYFSEKDLKQFINCDSNQLFNYHYGIGTIIRNEILNNDNALYSAFIKRNILHEDDMSALILKYFHSYIKSKATNSPSGGGISA